VKRNKPHNTKATKEFLYQVKTRNAVRFLIIKAVDKLGKRLKSIYLVHVENASCQPGPNTSKYIPFLLAVKG
jgi:hypothetical protein